MASPSVSIILIIVLVAIIRTWWAWRRRRRRPIGLKPLPGPRGYPLIGSIPDVPEKNLSIKFADWGKKYGPIYQVNLAGHNHVWVLSDDIARDLLSRRARYYSDRPHIPALVEDNRTSGKYLPLLSKNDTWVRQRKFASHIMRESAQAGFYRYPQLEAIRMLVELLDEPDRYNHALESFVSRVTCHLAWGHSEASDELKQRARELLISVSPTGALGNKLPFLMSLPAWLSPPKAWELRRAATEARWFSMMRDQVQADVRENRAPQSWMKTFLENPGRWGLTDTEKEPQWWKTISEQPRGWSPGFDEKAPSWTSVLRAISSKLRFIANDKDVSGGDEAAYCVGMHGIAGALTIAAPMQTFCLALAFHPQFLPPLHQEMDRVCGGRLPRSEDRPRLPFLRAVIRECLRWRPPVPTGIPHYLTQDDEYNGFHIPKGSVIHPLEWAISRDPKQFPYPEAFNPRRWIDPGYPTYQEPLTEYPTILNSTQFGYGQRKCQGQNVADEDLFIGLGSLVWLFNISRLEDNNITQSTNPKIDPTLDYSTLLIAKPLPFKFSLTPRDAWREAKVRALYAELAAKGEFPQSAEYWGEEFGKGKKYGWGKV